MASAIMRKTVARQPAATQSIDPHGTVVEPPLQMSTMVEEPMLLVWRRQSATMFWLRSMVDMLASVVTGEGKLARRGV